MPKGHPGRRLIAHLKRKMAAGLLVVVPFGITLFVLRFLFNLADGLLAPFIRGGLRLFSGRELYIPGLGMIVGFLVVYFAGLLATNLLGRRILARWDRFISRIPMVKPVYLSAKKVVEVFSRNRAHPAFREAVFVDFPRQGSFSLAYVTGESTSSCGHRYLCCFVPTIPNPMTGFVLMVEESRVYPARMSIEEAMRIILSGGIIAPEVIETDKLQ